MICIKFH